MGDAPEIRASDADRERVADALRRHCSEGRLSLDELGERLGEAYAARTIGDLTRPGGPLRELPALMPPPPHQLARAPAGAADVRDHRGRTLAEHATSYVTVNVVLVAIWALTGAGYFWPAWVLVFWGAGLLSHALRTAQGRRG